MVDYENFEKEMEFIERGGHLEEVDVAGSATVNPALLNKQQQLQKDLVNLEKQKAKIENDLAQIEKQIATERAAASKIK